MSGNYSLVAHVEALTAPAGLFMQLIVDKSLGSFYARAFVWGENIQGSNAIMLVTSTASPYRGLHVGVTSEGLFELTDWANMDVGAKMAIYLVSATALPGGWTCMEWHVADGTGPNVANGSSALLINGKEITDIWSDVLVTVPAAAPLGFFELGVQTNNLDVSVSAFDVWYDDLVIANEPIGCNP